MMPPDQTRIPVTVLTGFLGSGKTSLLNRLLKTPSLEGAMVLINEFGEVGIDHLLVETSQEEMIELSNGCLCCTIRSDLIDRLEDLLTRIAEGQLKRISRLIIETTGLADPVPILQLFMTHPLLLHRFHHDGVVTVVDAIHATQTLDSYEEARRQVALADRIVISKSDLLPEEGALHSLLAHLKNFNSTAEIHINDPTQKIDMVLLPTLLAQGFNRFDNKNFNLGHDHHYHHGQTIHSFCLEYDKPLPLHTIEAFLSQISTRYAVSIMRLKGIVLTTQHPDRPLVVQGIQGLFHPPQWLDGWGKLEHQTCLVLIVDGGVTRQEIEELFSSFSGQIGIDRADFQAFAANPLAIAGLKF